jgi:hypothetical protein
MSAKGQSRRNAKSSPGKARIREIIRQRIIQLSAIGFDKVYFQVERDKLELLAISLGYNEAKFRRMCLCCGLINGRGIAQTDWEKHLQYVISPIDLRILLLESLNKGFVSTHMST